MFKQTFNCGGSTYSKNIFCIDLVFTDQSDLSVNSGADTSLHQNCHHELVDSSFNLNIY